MKIAVNTRLLLADRLEGIGRFAHEILQRVVRLMPEHEFHFLFDRAFDPSFIYADNVIGHVVSPQARHPILYQIWFERSIAKRMKTIGADLLFSPEGYLSLKSPVPSINTIHDINFEHDPMLVDRAHRWHFRTYFPRYAAKAERVLTVSQFSKQDIVATYGLDTSKIEVVYNGVSDAFRPLDSMAQAAVRSQISDGAPYFVFVGSLHPRKNLVRLMQAFDAYKAKHRSAHRLVIIGKRAFKNEALDSTYKNLKYQRDVIFTGRLSEEDMIDAVASAEAMCYVPLFEGFGMPIVEAYRCGTAVIAANVSAIPEVAGNAALLIDPLQIEAIADAMGRIAQDPRYREALELSGLEQAKRYSWDKSAAQVVALLRKQLGEA